MEIRMIRLSEVAPYTRNAKKHSEVQVAMCSSRYKNFPAWQKRIALEKYFGDLLGCVDSVLPYIERNNPTETAKAAYYARKENAYGLSPLGAKTI